MELPGCDTEKAVLSSSVGEEKAGTKMSVQRLHVSKIKLLGGRSLTFMLQKEMVGMMMHAILDLLLKGKCNLMMRTRRSKS